MEVLKKNFNSFFSNLFLNAPNYHFHLCPLSGFNSLSIAEGAEVAWKTWFKCEKVSFFYVFMFNVVRFFTFSAVLDFLTNGPSIDVQRGLVLEFLFTSFSEVYGFCDATLKAKVCIFFTSLLKKMLTFLNVNNFTMMAKSDWLFFCILSRFLQTRFGIFLALFVS